MNIKIKTQLSIFVRVLSVILILFIVGCNKKNTKEEISPLTQEVLPPVQEIKQKETPQEFDIEHIEYIITESEKGNTNDYGMMYFGMSFDYKKIRNFLYPTFYVDGRDQNELQTYFEKRFYPPDSKNDNYSKPIAEIEYAGFLYRGYAIVIVIDLSNKDTNLILDLIIDKLDPEKFKKVEWFNSPPMIPIIIVYNHRWDDKYYYGDTNGVVLGDPHKIAFFSEKPYQFPVGQEEEYKNNIKFYELSFVYTDVYKAYRYSLETKKIEILDNKTLEVFQTYLGE